MSTAPMSTELFSVDDRIDAIAREALAEARRAEEAEKYRKNPGPLVAPDTSVKPLARIAGNTLESDGPYIR